MISYTLDQAAQSPILLQFQDPRIPEQDKRRLLSDELTLIAAQGPAPAAQANGVKRILKKLPPVRHYLRRRYARVFAVAERCNLFHGVFCDFPSAIASCPATKPVGYDQPGPAAMYRNHLDCVFAMDWPALLWLQAALEQGAKSVFDFGGHVGVAYYAFGAVLKKPEDLSWVVWDVPAVRAAGEKLSRSRNTRALSFTGDRTAASGMDVYYAAGSLQYSETSLAKLLTELSAKPRHVIVNKLPVTSSPTHATIQNIGVAFCPYWITNRAEFTAEVAALGYELVDSWRTPELSCEIPYERATGDIRYEGYYFRKRGH